MKKTVAKKVTRKETKVEQSPSDISKSSIIDRICDLVDRHTEGEITQDELVADVMTIVGKPIIKVSEVEFVVSEWEGQLYLESRQELSDGNKRNWVQVEDLCDFTVYEYNCLVTQLQEVYPDYQIEHLEGRFV